MPKGKSRGKITITQQKIFCCDHCEYQASNKKGLMMHLEYTHKIKTPQKNPAVYGCNICKKEFLKESSLNNHIRKNHR